MEDTSNDLVFDGERPVRFIDGSRLFGAPVRVGSADIYLAGRVLGQSVEELARSQSFSTAHGRFVLLIHDAVARKVELVNDRYGGVPLFRATAKGAIHLSTSMRRLVEAGATARDVDDEGLSELLAFNTPLEERCLLRGVKRVVGATRASFSLCEDSSSFARHWSPEETLKEAPIPYREARPSLQQVLLKSLLTSIEGRKCVGLTLSGGMDSRCLLAAAVWTGTHLQTYNTSIAGSRSAEYAAKLAAMTGMTHHFHPVGAEFARSYHALLRGVTELTEVMSLSSDVEALWLRNHVHGPEVMLHGSYAELSKLREFRTLYMDEEVMTADRSVLPDLLWRRFEARFHSRLKVFAPQMRKRLLEHPRRNLRLRLDKIDPGLNVPQALQVLFFQEILKTTNFSATVWNDRVPTDFPFSYPPYVDLMLRVLPAERMTQKFQMDFLRDKAPPLYRFPNSNTGLRVDAPPWLNQASRYWNLARRMLTGSKTALDHQDFAAWAAAMQPTPDEILNEGLNETVYDRAGIAELLVQLRRGNRRWGRILNRLQRVAGYQANLQMLFMLELGRERIGLERW